MQTCRQNVQSENDTHNGTGVPLHHRNEHYEFQWGQATRLEIEQDVNWRRLLEAIHIFKNEDITVNWIERGCIVCSCNDDFTALCEKACIFFYYYFQFS